ncbi:hypothetical protein [Gimesia sp.]|uniref:hypothetical protein n=1 Tax=Gimesia sp. TaxID=2024833 RepID=UPI003A92864D
MKTMSGFEFFVVENSRMNVSYVPMEDHNCYEGFRVPRTGLSGRAEWVWKLWFWIVRGNCDLLLAALGPDYIRAYPFLSWYKNHVGMF